MTFAWGYGREHFNAWKRPSLVPAYNMLLLLFIVIPNVIFFLFVIFLETPVLTAEPYASMSYVSIITAITNNNASHVLLTYGVLHIMLGALCVISLNPYNSPLKERYPHFMGPAHISNRHYHSIG